MDNKQVGQKSNHFPGISYAHTAADQEIDDYGKEKQRVAGKSRIRKEVQISIANPSKAKKTRQRQKAKAEETKFICV